MTYSVLLIEDELGECSVVSKYLRRNISEPIDILCCNSYEEAFGPLFCRDWDLVLINYHVNDNKGLETLRRVCGLLEERVTPTIVYYDNSVDSLDLEKVQEFGAADFLSVDEMIQPSGIARLVSHLEKCSSFDLEA